MAIEKARLEQEIIALNSVKSDLEQRKEKEKQLATKLSDVEHRMMEIEAENKVLNERKGELETARDTLQGELEQQKTLIGERDTEVGNGLLLLIIPLFS